MIGIIDFGIKKVPIEYNEIPKLEKDPYGRYYIKYFKFSVESKYMYFFKLWFNDSVWYSDNSRKLNIVLDGTLTLIGVFPTMIDENNNQVTISIDTLSEQDYHKLPPPPPPPPSRVIGGGKKVQEEQEIIQLEYHTKLEKYKYEMERYKELNNKS